jgi:hypothetical protein
VAVRPEKVNLFPASGTMRYPDGTQDDANTYKTALLRDPDINLVQGIVKYSNYIGTDTRYIVSIGREQEMVARIQNFGLRTDTVFALGQPANIFWDAEHSRILTE